MADQFNLNMAVLRLLKTRKNYDRFKNMIPEGTVTKETTILLKRFGEYFAAVDGADEIQHEAFWPFLRSKYPKWKQKDADAWDAMTKPIDKPNPKGYDERVIENLLATDLGNKALALIENYTGGGEVNLAEALRDAVDRFDSQLERKVKADVVELDWDAMIEEDELNEGFQWRLGALARHMRALRAGDFGVIAMRPDRGKTSLVASEVTFMAPQALELYPDEFRPVLWLNNEGPGTRIVSRARQATLGLSITEIRDLGGLAAKALYAKTMGRADMLQVVDIHGWSNYDVEELIRRKNPSLVIFDMIDNIHFSGVTINGGERTDQLLEAMYQWARSLAVRYSFVGLATSQVSAEGEGLQYPLQSQLKDSRTGKQGACDFIITGGFDPNRPKSRFIGTTKNKLKREGEDPSPRAEVFFDEDRSRFVMPEEVE